MVGTTDALLAAQRAAIRKEGDAREQLHRAVEAHVRFHAEHPREAFVAGREVDSLAEPHRAAVLRKRAEYERRLRQLVETGVRDGVLAVGSPRLAAYAILDMGAGVAGWLPVRWPGQPGRAGHLLRRPRTADGRGQPVQPPAEARKPRLAAPARSSGGPRASGRAAPSAACRSGSSIASSSIRAASTPIS